MDDQVCLSSLQLNYSPPFSSFFTSVVLSFSKKKPVEKVDYTHTLYLSFQYYFSHLNQCSYCSWKPTNTYENWECKRWEITNSQSLGPIIQFDQSKAVVKIVQCPFGNTTFNAWILAQSHYTPPNQHKLCLLFFIQNKLCHVPIRILARVEYMGPLIVILKSRGTNQRTYLNEPIVLGQFFY
jgi:hypothetical protein